MKVFKIILALLVILVVVMIFNWSNMINWMMPADSRPAVIEFTTEQITPAEFEQIAQQLSENYELKFNHIERFHKAGIMAYEGPKTCLGCHQNINFEDQTTNEKKSEDLMTNLTKSAHYRFFTERHPNVYGFNGELADNFAMGKINRPCPKPGSFAFTAWAEIVVKEDGDTLSEGCGQCHIGGQYQAPLGEMMPLYQTLDEEKDAIDCLICHSAAYDMNQKQVVVDKNGRKRWTMDRSMPAAMSVTAPTSQTCLRCHQHNFGGDIYIDIGHEDYMPSMINTGHDRPRVLHPGSKRGTPFSPTWDVHAAAGVDCIECHVTEGHRIAKGTHTTTMMANDLPFVEVACENCHTDTPHADIEYGDYYDSHFEKLACQTCHIPSLQEDNATMRNFGKAVYEEAEGIYIYDDSVKESLPGKGIVYRWWNGDGTFLGNPIGDNPNGKDLYYFYTANMVWPEFSDYDYKGWYDSVMRPIAKNGRPSKLYAVKKFQGKQHIDLGNITPFGGMYVPYNLPTYYTSGNPTLAGQTEAKKSMMRMMYGFMFKYYMLDKFMGFMDADGWNMGSYDDVINGKNIEPRWIPNDASLEISHAIRKEGALTCGNCHSQNSVLDFKSLGYNEDDIESLSENPL